MRLIGCRCKASDGFSWAVLIGRGLDLVPDLLLPLFSFEGALKLLILTGVFTSVFLFMRFLWNILFIMILPE